MQRVVISNVSSFTLIKCVYVLVMMKVLPIVKVFRVLFWLRQCTETVGSD